MEEVLKKLRDLRDNTPCNEESHRYCGCEKFDEIIDMITDLNEELQWWRTYGEFVNANYSGVCAEASAYADGDID